jgi:glycosyltransferase involved in cell wall biosynthesis
MKVSLIGQKGIPAHAGGIERHVEELAKELVTHGHDVTAYCRKWYTDAPDYYEGIRCIYTPCMNSKHLDAITHTFTSIVDATRRKMDVIHIHGVGPALLAWLPKLLRPQVKVVVTFHCVDRYHQKWNWFARTMLHLGEWMACKAADATITVSETLQRYCRIAYNTETLYVPNGTQIPMEPAEPEEIAQFSLQPYKYLMMCSRLVRHKNAHKLIRAWKELRAEEPELLASWKLAIVGGSAFTDDYVREVEALAKGENSIVLTGNQGGKSLYNLFANAYAIVHPSESEGLPIAVLEAMSYGKCVLSSDIPECAELTAENGLTFETNNLEELKQKMKMMLEHPDKVSVIGQDARTHVARHYDWKDIAEKTTYLYELTMLEPMLLEATN